MSPRFTMPALLPILCAAALLSGCASQKTPATADVAVSQAAVENAAQAGAAELAPAELLTARENVERAKQARADKDSKLGSDLAQQAQADARLAQSKASSSKATGAANEVQENIRVLREELDRANNANK